MRARLLKSSVAVFAVSAVSAISALAEDVNVQTFQPRANSIYTLNETAAPWSRDIDPRARFLFSATAHTLNDPLVILNSQRTTRLNTPIDGLRTLDLLAGYELGGRASIGAALPLHSIHRLNESRESALGDLRLFSKIFLSRPSNRTQFALIPEATLPTGAPGRFVSDGGAGFGLLGAVEHQFNWVRAAFNVGFRGNADSVVGDLDYRRRLFTSIGLTKPIGPHWAVNLEAIRTTTLPFNGNQNPNELQAGARYRWAREWALAGAASVGTLNRVSSGNHRFLLSLAFTPLSSGSSSSFGDSVSSPSAGPVRAAEPAPPVATNEAAPPPATVIDEIRTETARTILTPESIHVDQEIGFKHDSADLMPAARESLLQVAKLILRNLDSIEKVRIEGHTNEIGPDAYNLRLSWRRAQAVEGFLVENGVASTMIQAEGFGERRPKPGSAKFPRAIRLVVNRRVEFRVDPKETNTGERAASQLAPPSGG